jgi:hypothetical protein
MANMVFGLDPVNKKLLWEKNLFAPLDGHAGNQDKSLQNCSLTIDPRDGAAMIVWQDGWIQRLGQTGPLEGNVICLQTREALLGIDPVTGRTLWTRSDVSPRCHIFGDEQMIYVVDMNNDNSAAQTRALRAYDGVTVKVPDFAKAYSHRVHQLGRTLLVNDPQEKGEMQLRLYDVATGQDLWKETFASGSTVLKSEDPHLGGVIDPHGKVKVINLETHKVCLQAQVDPSYIAGANSVHLLADSRDYYVGVTGPPNPQQFMGNLTPLMVGTGLRGLQLNGRFYAFHGQTGKLHWYADISNQMVLLEAFQELPVVMFASRFQRWNVQPNIRNIMQGVTFRSYHKATGKLLYDKEDLPNTVTFHALHIDKVNQKIDLIGNQIKITHHLNPDATVK